MKYFIFLIVLIGYLFASVNENNKSIFTKEEIEWIKNNPVVKVGIDEDWPPFEYLDTDKKHNGISSEYLNIISEKTGLKFDIYASSWHNVMERIKNKELDILACAAKTSERETFLDFTIPYLSLDAVIVAKKDLKLESFDDVKKYKVAVQKSDYTYDALIKKFPNLEFVFVESNSDALKAVSYGKADLYIDNLPTISYFIEKNLLTNLEIKTKAELDSTELSIAVIKEKNILKNIIEKVLKDINQEVKKEIQKKWAFSSSEINNGNFTKEELDWIKNNPVVIAGIEKDWAPFDIVNKENQYSGINKDFFDLIEIKSGLKFQYKPDTWSNVLEKFKRKEVDILPSMTISEDRKKYTLFTNSYFNYENYAFIHTDHTDINTLEELSKLKISIVKGYEIINTLKSKYPNIQIVEVDDIKEGLDKVLTKKVDAYIDGYIATNYYIETNMLSSIKLGTSINLNLNKLHFGIIKEKPILASIIKKSLNNITNEEKSVILNRWTNKAKDISNYTQLSHIDSNKFMN